MQVRLARVSVNRFGKRVERIQLLNVDALKVGRGTDNQLQFPDPMIGLHHATFVEKGEGIRVLAHGDLRVDGTPTREAAVHPGSVVQIGTWTLAVAEAKEGERLHLEISGQAAAAPVAPPPPSRPSARVDRARRTRRYLALTGCLAIVTALLLLPLSYRDARARFAVPPASQLRRAAWRAQASWSAGPLTHAHAQIADDDACCATPATCASQPYKACDRCAGCHSTSFDRVRDRDCLGCHAGVGAHITAAAGVPAAATRDAADMHCTTCHHEHRGDAELTRAADGFCTTCHADIHAHFPGAEIANVAQFATHPQFKVSVFTGVGSAGRTRVSLSDLAACPSADPRATSGTGWERAGIEFSHARHLRAISGPSDKLETLDCANCHTPSDDRGLMRKATFVTHCERCHQLTFVGAAAGHVAPHSQPAKVAAAIWEYFSGQGVANAPPPPGTRRHVGAGPADRKSFGGADTKPATQRVAFPVPAQGGPGDGNGDVWTQFAAAAVQKLEQPAVAVEGVRLPGIHEPPPAMDAASVVASAARATENLLGPKGSCQMCHSGMDLTRTDREVFPVFVVPVEEEMRWLPRATFTHGPHEKYRCEDCHDVARVAPASWYVMLPGVEKCRECHADVASSGGKVPSHCVSCHRFHDPAHGAMQASDGVESQPSGPLQQWASRARTLLRTWPWRPAAHPDSRAALGAGDS